MNFTLPVFKVFRQVETVIVTPKVHEACLHILAVIYSGPRLSSRSILIENEGTIVLAATIPL